MRNVSKNKVLLCFRPVDIDVMLEPKPVAECPPSRRFACFPLEERSGMKSSENSTASPPTKRTLSRVIRAVVFETILNRRANQKSGCLRDSYGSKHNYSTNTKTSSTGDVKSTLSHASVDTNKQRIKINSVSSSSSSCGSGSCCLSEGTEPRNLAKSYPAGAKGKETNYQAPIKKQKNWDWTGIYLLVMSLALTILWGKILGIILTSICLCFQSRSAASDRRPQEVANLAKIGSRVYNEKRGDGGRKVLQ